LCNARRSINGITTAFCVYPRPFFFIIFRKEPRKKSRKESRKESHKNFPKNFAKNAHQPLFTAFHRFSFYQMTLKKILPAALCTVLGVGIGIVIANSSLPMWSGDPVNEQVRKFKLVLDQANRSYVDEVQPAKLTESAIKAMLSELDPHSIYIPAEQRERDDEDFRGNFEGIGVFFELVQDTITVISPISDGPSERAGILAGDKIVKINGQNAVGITDKDVMKKLKGARGTRVTLGVKRPSEKSVLDYVIVRDRIPIYSVESKFMFDNTDIGYINVNRFAATTVDEFTEAARSLKKLGMKKLVLDLRHNPGGYLEQAFELADAFIPAGKKIVYTKGRQTEFNDEYISTGGGEFENLPLIVLIDEGSASASEIVAGSIQDLDRGLIVGETSFGKGLVQRPYDLPDKSQYRLTISRYYTPSGRSIQRSYKNAAEYKNLAGRAELDEGDNIQHSKKTETPDSTRPLFRTVSGRKVYGGGGIVPDYVIKQDTVTKLSIKLVNKSVLREFVDETLAASGGALRKQYKTDFSSFASGYDVSAAMLARLKTLATQKGVEWNDAEFAADEKFLKTRIKSDLARAIWNLNEEQKIEIINDKQVQKALQLFPEAKKIAQMR
jgi:carboxyl-terminal processing protease